MRVRRRSPALRCFSREKALPPAPSHGTGGGEEREGNAFQRLRSLPLGSILPLATIARPQAGEEKTDAGRGRPLQGRGGWRDRLPGVSLTISPTG